MCSSGSSSHLLLLFSVTALNKKSEKHVEVGKAVALHNDLENKGGSEKQKYLIISIPLPKVFHLSQVAL